MQMQDKFIERVCGRAIYMEEVICQFFILNVFDLIWSDSNISWLLITFSQFYFEKWKKTTHHSFAHMYNVHIALIQLSWSHSHKRPISVFCWFDVANLALVYRTIKICSGIASYDAKNELPIFSLSLFLLQFPLFLSLPQSVYFLFLQYFGTKRICSDS